MEIKAGPAVFANVANIASASTASAQSEADEANRLGMMYSSGDGVPQDWEQARAWFRKAADRGHANAQFNLGVI